MYWNKDLPQVTQVTGRKRKIEAGDVFRFPIASTEFAYGQVIFSDILQYVVIYAPIIDAHAPLTNLEQLPILLSGWTMDAKLKNGDWELLDRMEPPTALQLPIYKVGISGKTWVTDFRGHALRPATDEEDAVLPFKSSQSPGLYEDAFKAHHGLAPWQSHFEKLLHKYDKGAGR